MVGWDDGNVAKTRHCAWHLGSCNLEFLLTLGSYQFSVQQEEKDITGVLPHVPKLRCPFWGTGHRLSLQVPSCIWTRLTSLSSPLGILLMEAFLSSPLLAFLHGAPSNWRSSQP